MSLYQSTSTTDSPILHTNTEMMSMESSSNAFTRCKDSISYLSKGTIFSSIFNLLTTSIGAGTLALPFAYSQGGIIFSSVVFFFIMVMAIIVGLYLYEGKRVCQGICPNMEVRGYEDLAEVAFGAFGRISVLVILAVLLLLTIIAYMIYTRDQLDFIIRFILYQTGHIPSCSLFTNCAIVMCLAFLPLFPVLLLKKLSLLQVTSTVSIICVVFVTIMISIKTGIYYHNPNNTITIATLTKISDNDNEVIIGLFPQSIKGAITCISYCSLTFLCHFQLFSLEKELYKPKKWKLNFIVIFSMLIAYCVYNAVAFAGYLRFGGDTSEDIMTNYPSDNILVTTLRIALFFTLLFSYPVLFHPTRDAINRLVAYIMELYQSRGGNGLEGVGVIQEADNEPNETSELLASANIYTRFRRYNEKMMHRKEVKVNWLVWFCETWALFSVSFLPAAFIPNVGYVWSFVGAIGGSLVLYILPSVLYLRLRYFLKLKMAAETGTSLRRQYLQCSVMKDLIGLVILITGIFVLVAGNYEAIDSIVQRSHDSPGSRCSSIRCLFLNETATSTVAGDFTVILGDEIY